MGSMERKLSLLDAYTQFSEIIGDRTSTIDGLKH